MGGDYSRFPFDPKRNYFAVLLQQGRTLLDADWNEQSAIASRGMRAAIVDVLGPVFLASQGAFKIESDGHGGLAIGRGRIYVDGLVAENHGVGRPVWDAALEEQHGAEPVSYTQQPYLPAATKLPRSGGPYLVYLDVWQREVTMVEDPDLVDPALGGADTTTRLQTVWQVKFHKASSTSAKSSLKCKFMTGSRLSTVLDSYTGAENQLYRIEIHDSGRAGVATFKWSRDNGSTVNRVTGLVDLAHLVVQVSSETAPRFSDGDLIEITDDVCEFAGLPGELRRIKEINAASGMITLDTPLSPGLFSVDPNGAPNATRHMRMRLWNGTGVIRDPGSRIDLEDGIAVRFDTDPAGACFRTGDYWVIPARVANRSTQCLDRAPPRGIHHHMVELALFTPPRQLRDLRLARLIAGWPRKRSPPLRRR